MAILVLTLAGFLTGTIQNVFWDDFQVEDDFTIPSPALTNPSSSTYCQQGGGIQYYRGGSGYKQTICNDGKWETQINNDFYYYTGTAYSNSVGVENGKLNLYAGSMWATGGATAKYLTNLKNKDFKTSFSMTKGYQTGSVSFGLTLNNQLIYSDSLTGGSHDQARTNDYLIEVIKSIENPDEFFIVVNGNEIKSIIIPENEAYLTYSFSSGGGLYSGYNSLSVDYLKSRPYFNCEVEADEIVIRDEFSTDFSYKELTYIPVKYCIDSYPIVVRSMTEQGVRADIKGELTRKLATGKTISVQPDTTVQVHYIADYQEGMAERCPIDSVYNVITKKCEKFIHEAEDIVTIINNITTIIVGKNQYYFTNQANIGNLQLTSTKPEFTCDRDNDYHAPEPAENCWTTEVDFDGETREFQTNQESDLNDYLSLKYTAEARFDKEQDEVEESSPMWKNHFVLTITDWDFITIEKPTTKFYHKLNSNDQMTFTLTNDLADFTESGFKITKTTDLITQETSEMVSYPFEQGRNEISLPIDTDMLGEITYVITPYLKIGSEVFFVDKQITRSFKITATGEEPEPTVITNIISEVPSWAYWLIGILAVVLMAVIIIAFVKKSGKKRKR